MASHRHGSKAVVVAVVLVVVVEVSVADAAVDGLIHLAEVVVNLVHPDVVAEAAVVSEIIMGTIKGIGGETITDHPTGDGMTEETMIDMKDVIGTGIEFNFE